MVLIVLFIAKVMQIKDLEREGKKRDCIKKGGWLVNCWLFSSW